MIHTLLVINLVAVFLFALLYTAIVLVLAKDDSDRGPMAVLVGLIAFIAASVGSGILWAIGFALVTIGRAILR